MTQPPRRPIARRLSLLMLTLSFVFGVTSMPFGIRNFPNCVSARMDSSWFAVGALSHEGLSSVFVTIQPAYLRPGKRVWSERSDGHFCGFQVPPTEGGRQPSGFNVHIGLGTIGWDCPYLLMMGAWGFVYMKIRPRHLTTIDLLWMTAVIAIVCAVISTRVALLCTVPLNLVTLGLVIFGLVRAGRLLSNSLSSSTQPSSSRTMASTEGLENGFPDGDFSARPR